MNELKIAIDLILASEDFKASYWIKDMTRGTLIEKDSLKRFNAASVIKLYLLMAALDEVRKGHLSLDQRFLVTEEEKVGGCGVLKLLSPETTLSLEDLLYLMIDVSDNTATNRLFDIIGQSTIEQYLECHIYKNTCVARKLMRVIPGLTNYTSASDVGHLLNDLLEGMSVDEASKSVALKILSEQQINHKLSSELWLCNRCKALMGHDNRCPSCGVLDMEPMSVPFAHKTGEISTASHDAGIMTVNNRQVIVVLMMDEICHMANALESHHKVGRQVYEYFSALVD